MKLTTVALAVMAGVLGGGVVIMVDSMTNHNSQPQVVLDAGTVQQDVADASNSSDDAGVNAGFAEEENQSIEILVDLVCEDEE